MRIIPFHAEIGMSVGDHPASWGKKIILLLIDSLSINSFQDR